MRLFDSKPPDLWQEVASLSFLPPETRQQLEPYQTEFEAISLLYQQWLTQVNRLFIGFLVSFFLFGGYIYFIITSVGNFNPNYRIIFILFSAIMTLLIELPLFRFLLQHELKRKQAARALLIFKTVHVLKQLDVPHLGITLNDNRLLDEIHQYWTGVQLVRNFWLDRAEPSQYRKRHHERWQLFSQQILEHKEWARSGLPTTLEDLQQKFSGYLLSCLSGKLGEMLPDARLETTASQPTNWKNLITEIAAKILLALLLILLAWLMTALVIVKITTTLSADQTLWLFIIILVVLLMTVLKYILPGKEIERFLQFAELILKFKP